MFKQINNTLVEMTEEEIAAFKAETEKVEIEFTTKANLNKRVFLLAETDWYVIRATETATEVPADVATYRQALRDITGHANWPNLADDDWPVKP